MLTARLPLLGDTELLGAALLLLAEANPRSELLHLSLSALCSFSHQPGSCPPAIQGMPCGTLSGCSLQPDPKAHPTLGLP